MTAEIVLTNARVVLPEYVVDGTVVIRDGRRMEIDAAELVPAGAEDAVTPAAASAAQG